MYDDQDPPNIFDGPENEPDLTEQQLTALANVCEESAKLAGRHDAAIRGLYDRIERLEALLLGYARVKGDGALVERFLQREKARQANPERKPPAWPEPHPFPELPEIPE